VIPNQVILMDCGASLSGSGAGPSSLPPHATTRREAVITLNAQPPALRILIFKLVSINGTG
jgi:hypothetical protein